MNTLRYNLPLESLDYIMTCTNEQLDTYTQFLIDEGAYRIILNNEVIYEK